MLSIAFFNPLLLWALPLAAVPIIIHLLNRRRFNKVPWAAMEYLLRAMKRNRRRIQMEHWIVLLLRTLAVIALVFLVTRPQLTGSGGLLKARAHHVICLDDSASMAERVGASNVFKLGVDSVNALVGKLIDKEGGDLVTLILASQHDQQPLLFATRVGPDLKKKVRDLLSARVVGDSVLGAGQLLSSAKKWAEEKRKDARDVHYYLVTDSRLQDFVSDGKPNPGVLKHLEEMDVAHTRMSVISVGPGETQNLGITQVRRRNRLAMAGTSVTLEVEIHNFGDESSTPTEVAVEILGTSQVVRPVPAIPAGGHVVIDVDHTFREPGFHGVKASLRKDRYPVDDLGVLALEVVGSSDVLIINGDPGNKPEESETFYLSAALDSDVEVLTGISVTEIPPHMFADYDLSKTNMIWLANVAAPTDKDIAKLESFCAAGGGVVFFLGDQVDAESYNRKLYKDGAGLLPLPLLDLKGDAERPDAPFVADRTHYAVKDNAEVMSFVFSKMVDVRRYYAMAEPREKDAVSVPVRVKSSNGSPLLADKTFRGGGQSVAIGTTSDLGWSDLCISPVFLVLCQEIHKHATKAMSTARYNLRTTGSLVVELDPAEYRRDVLVRAQGGQGFEGTFTAVDRDAETGGKVTSVLNVPMTRVEGLGLFELTLAPHRGQAETRLIGRSAPSSEGRLQKLSKAAWKRIYPAEVQDRLDVIEEKGSDSAVAVAGEGEVWRMLAFALLAFLLLESVLAWRFGRR
ncbi:MAG: BatA domain-containing protein [Planctomycetes bacterium]|nr:BatA domain-containing protein [Planctomycetota bacterium]MCB9871458.1 BatA domain-containing protein [Planctomycetota bacterium]